MRLAGRKKGIHQVEYIVILLAIIVTVIVAAAGLVPDAVNRVMSESAEVIRNSPG